MAQDTLLEIVNSIALELRFSVTTGVVGNSEKDIATIFDAVKKAADIDVFRAHAWSLLAQSFEVTPDTETAIFVLPLDFDYIINDTDWDHINQIPGNGGLSIYDFQRTKYGQFSISNARLNWTQGGHDYGGSVGLRKVIEFFPELPVSTPPEIAFSLMYMSKWYVIDGSTNAAKESLEGDDDTFAFDTQMVEKAALVRMLRTLGLSFQSEQEEFQAILDDRRRKDKAARNIDTTFSKGYNVDHPNIPGYVRSFRRP